MKSVWKLNNREVHVVNLTSGQYKRYEVRVLWSRKLGLTLKNVFVNEKEAYRLAEKITRKGIINIECWDKRFHPRRFLDSYCGD